MIKSIVCVSNNFGIGKNNDLLFHLKADLQRFKSLTSHNLCVMGYNTLLSLPNSKPLKNRTTVVLCPEGTEPEGCIVYHDFIKLMHDIQLIAKEQDVFICGGGMLYNTTIDYCDEVLLTRVLEDVQDAQVFFPNLDERADFELASQEEKMSESGHDFVFQRYLKKKEVA